MKRPFEKIAANLAKQYKDIVIENEVLQEVIDELSTLRLDPEVQAIIDDEEKLDDIKSLRKIGREEKKICRLVEIEMDVLLKVLAYIEKPEEKQIQLKLTPELKQEVFRYYDEKNLDADDICKFIINCRKADGHLYEQDIRRYIDELMGKNEKAITNVKEVEPETNSLFRKLLINLVNAKVLFNEDVDGNPQEDFRPIIFNEYLTKKQ